jgi:hypothetical protein
MPWGSSAPNQTFSRTDGTRNGTTTWQQADAAGVDIISPDHDTHDQDVSDGINACLKKDGGNTATADIPMGGFTLTNIAAAGALTEPARYSDVKNSTATYYPTVGGTADAITLAGTGAAITAYAAGQRFSFLNTGGPNTGAATVNVDGVGAKDIKRNDGSATALSAADMPDNALVVIEYDGTRFLLLIPAQAGADLAAIEALTGTGIPRRTGTNTWALDAGPAHLAATTANRLIGTDGSGAVGVATITSPLAYSSSALSVGAASDTATGVQENAVQSEMEAASSTTLNVTPGRQHFHPGHPKAGGNFDGSGTPAFRSGDYGMGAITDGGTGIYTLALDTAFSGTEYWPAAWSREAAVGNDLSVCSAFSAASKTTSAFQVHVGNPETNSLHDSTETGISFWGDYA